MLLDVWERLHSIPYRVHRHFVKEIFRISLVYAIDYTAVIPYLKCALKTFLDRKEGNCEIFSSP